MKKYIARIIYKTPTGRIKTKEFVVEAESEKKAINEGFLEFEKLNPKNREICGCGAMLKDENERREHEYRKSQRKSRNFIESTG